MGVGEQTLWKWSLKSYVFLGLNHTISVGHVLLLSRPDQLQILHSSHSLVLTAAMYTCFLKRIISIGLEAEASNYISMI